MPLQKEFMDDIEKDDFVALQSKILLLQTEQDKLNLVNILNATTELGITPFARAVHKLPQNPAKWSIIIINMIMAGADVTAIYPNSHYTVLERLNLYAEIGFFKELSSYLFSSALSEGNMRLLYSLIARNPFLIERLRISYKKEFYISLQQQISLLPDSTELNYLSFENEAFVGNDFVSQPHFIIEKKATYLIDLINLLTPSQCHKTIDKRKWYYLVLALKGRALCIANRRPLYNLSNKTFFEQLFKHRIKLFSNIDQYFTESITTIATHDLNKVLEKDYHIDLAAEIEKQTKYLLSSSRIAVMTLLKAHHNRIEQQNRINTSATSPENGTDALSKDEIECIEKILSLAKFNKESIVSALDEKTLLQVENLIEQYYKQLKSDHSARKDNANQIKNNNIPISEAHYKKLYTEHLGALPSALPANINSYKEFYTRVKDIYFNLETMKSKFRYAILHSLSVCINQLIKNCYFALEESWIQQALFDAISQMNSDILTAIIEAKPILVFWMADPIKGPFWEYLLSLINNKNIIDIAIKVMDILQNSFKIPGQTLLPFASLFGVVEIIDTILDRYEDELLESDDLMLSFEYAIEYHHYDIIIKLINHNIYFESIKESINIERFANALQFATFDIADIEGLKYFYNLIAVEFKKILTIDQSIIPASLKTQNYKAFENTQNKWWPILIICLKTRANSILNNTTHKYTENDIFVKIDKLYIMLGLEHKSYDAPAQTKLASSNALVPNTVPSEIEQILSNNLNVDRTETNPQLYFQVIFKYIHHLESELILQLMQLLYRSLLYRPRYQISENDKNKILHSIDDGINKIKNGKTKWLAVLVQLIKIAVKVNCISSAGSETVVTSLRYLISDQDFKCISHYLLRIKYKLGFITQTTTQEILKVTAPNLTNTYLDRNRTFRVQLNDILLRATQSKFALQMANVNYQAKLRDIHKPRWISPVKWKKIYHDFMADYPENDQSSKIYFKVYRDLIKEFNKINPKNKLHYAVKLNKNKWVELLLENVSHSYEEWDNDTKAAFAVALSNNNLSHCAKSCIDHLSCKDWKILVESKDNQLSIIKMAEKNDNAIVQIAILNKILISNFFPKHFTLFHLAVLFELPNTLRNYILINNNKIDKHIDGGSSLTSFESAIHKNFFAGIFCFLEYSENSLASLKPQIFEDLCLQYSRLAMNIRDISQFEKLVCHLSLINQYYTSNQDKFTINITIKIGLLKLAILLVSLRFGNDQFFSRELIEKLINSIEFDLPLPIFAKYFKQLQLILYNKLIIKYKDDPVSNLLTDMRNKHCAHMSNVNHTALINIANTTHNGVLQLQPDQKTYLNPDNIIYIFLDSLLNDNIINIYKFMYHLVNGATQLHSIIAEAYISAINCAVEFNLFTQFKDLLQCLLETLNKSPLIFGILQTCLEYILIHRRYKYLEYILNILITNQLYIKLANLNIFSLAISDEIDITYDLKELIHIYNKINSIYKPYLIINGSESVKLFIQRIKNKFVSASNTSQTKNNNLEYIRAILWTEQNGSDVFYECLLSFIKHCTGPDDFEYIENQLQQWLQFLSTSQILNPLHLLLTLQTRISIYEQYFKIIYKQSRNRIDEQYFDLSKFPSIQLPINSMQTIIFCNEKLRLLSFNKTNSAIYVDETTVPHKENTYLFYSNIIDKNSFTLLEAVITLSPIADIFQQTLNSEQERICATIISLLENNIKISHQFYHKLKNLLPILTLFKTSLFCANSLKPAKSVISHVSESTKPINPLDLEFEICNMTKSLTEDSFTDLDRSLDVLVTTKLTEDKYISLLDKIIDYMSGDYVLHASSIPILQNIWQSLHDRIEQCLNNQVTGALIPQYTNTQIYINENSDDVSWLDRFNKEFGNAPINFNKEQYFYQKLYKSTLLKFHYLLDIKDQFDYCINHQLLCKLEQIVKSSASSLLYAQLQAAFAIALNFNAMQLIFCILPHIDPFDIFILKDAHNKSYWQSINQFPENEFTLIASLILNNIKNYLLNNQLNLITLSICFDMGRMTIYLLKSTANLYEADIKSAFQTAIHCRNYQCVSVLIDDYYQKYPNAFRMNKNHFYNYLYDEIAVCITKNDIELFRIKLSKQYVLIKNQYQKSSLFAARDNDWQSIVDKTEIRRKELESLEMQIEQIPNQNKNQKSFA